MEETKKCPYCGEEILAVARKCKHCGTWLEPQDAASQQDEAFASPVEQSTVGGGIKETKPVLHKVLNSIVGAKKKVLVYGSAAAVVLVVVAVSTFFVQRKLEDAKYLPYAKALQLDAQLVDSVANVITHNYQLTEDSVLRGQQIFNFSTKGYAFVSTTEAMEIRSIDNAYLVLSTEILCDSMEAHYNKLKNAPERFKSLKDDMRKVCDSSQSLLALCKTPYFYADMNDFAEKIKEPSNVVKKSLANIHDIAGDANLSDAGGVEWLFRESVEWLISKQIADEQSES